MQEYWICRKQQNQGLLGVVLEAMEQLSQITVVLGLHTHNSKDPGVALLVTMCSPG